MNIRVSDIKQYFYCPRVVYHTYYTPVSRPTTHPMQLGAVEHEVLSVLERRRTLSRYGLDAGSRQFHISLHAESLGLSGVLDLLIETEDGAFPVEFKSTTQRLNLNAKYQLTAYALMVEAVSRSNRFLRGLSIGFPHSASQSFRFQRHFGARPIKRSSRYGICYQTSGCHRQRHSAENASSANFVDSVPMCCEHIEN